MEVKETIKAINDIIPVLKVITGEAICNNEKKIYSYINNYNYSLILKEDGYINCKVILNLDNQENFRINDIKVKSFITDGNYLYHIINNQ